jgi:putative ABC transport system permease protein
MMGGEFQYIAAQVKDRGRIPEVITEINERMSDSVKVMSAESMGEMVGSILGVIEGTLGGIAAISLLVAGVGIVNTMTISVMERTREIGVLKALGAKSRDVLLMFLSEALVTGFIGGTLGVLLGFALGGLIGRYINLPVSNSIFLGMSVVAFAITTSALSGLYPAWRAANLRPVEALRHE